MSEIEYTYIKSSGIESKLYKGTKTIIIRIKFVNTEIECKKS